MESVIVSLVKCKPGDLSDVNYYRAITISTAVSKLFESVLLSHVKSTNESDNYQFGFTPGCSTSLCTTVFKGPITIAIRAQYNILRGVMCFRAIMNMSILLRCCRML